MATQKRLLLKVSLVLILALGLSACGKDAQNSGGSASVSGKSSEEAAPVSNNATLLTGSTIADSTAKSSHILQITALNFLAGGEEPCNVKNKIFTFSEQDEKAKVVICTNSKVEVFAVSNLGAVTFHAVDLMMGQELFGYDLKPSQSFELGKTKEMLRYGVKNPYGFTYVMAEEFTNVDPQLLEQWNQLNGRQATLTARVLTARQNGQEVPKSVLQELDSICEQMDKLALKIMESRNS